MRLDLPMGGSLKIPSDLSLPLLYIISNNLFPNYFFLWCKFICNLCVDIVSSMTLMSVLKECGDDFDKTYFVLATLTRQMSKHFQAQRTQVLNP